MHKDILRKGEVSHFSVDIDGDIANHSDLSDYYSVIARLLVSIFQKMSDLACASYYFAPKVDDICLDLKLILYRDIVNVSNNIEIIEKMKQCSHFLELLASNTDSINTIKIILAYYKVSFVYSELSRKNSLLYQSDQYRKSLPSGLANQLANFLNLTNELTIGSSIIGENSLFDALAQALNVTQNTDKYNEKYLCEMYEQFCSENKALIASWDIKDFRKSKAMGTNVSFECSSLLTEIVQKQKINDQLLVGRYGLFSHNAKSVETLESLFHKSIPRGWCIGEAIGEGDCFFDAVAQALNEKVSDNQYSIKSLRLLCDEYVKSKTENNAWVKHAVESDRENYDNYVARLQFTIEEIKENETRMALYDTSTWGRPNIEGKIICEKLGIQLHIIEGREAIADVHPVMLTHQLINAAKSHDIQEDKADFSDPNLIHIAVMNLHFVPILNKTKLHENNNHQRRTEKSTGPGEISLQGLLNNELRVLCAALALPAIHIIAVASSSEYNSLTVNHYFTTKNEGMTRKENVQTNSSKDIPILIVEQSEFHFVPVLPYNNIELQKFNGIDEYEEAVREDVAPEIDSSVLFECGYTEQEINSYLEQGVSPIVLQKLTNSEFKLSKEQSIACIKNCIDMGDSSEALARQRELVLFLGNTGSGKSTAINYLYGCKLVRDSRRVIVSPDSLQPEVTAIGHARWSKTFTPQIIVSEGAGLVFCDLSGFEDNRGPEINIANSVNRKRVLLAADAIKILLLISFESLYVDRGRAIAELNTTLCSLFGSVDNLKMHFKSILIGITKAPSVIDDDEITTDVIREHLFHTAQLPSELKSRTFIIDPLDKNSHSMSRQTWLESIKNMKAIKTSTHTFNTTLTATDKLFLIDISRAVSDKINGYLEVGQFKAAINYLTMLSSMRIIDHPAIEEHFRDNLLNFSMYIALQEQKVFDLSDEANFAQAEEKLKKMKELISIFQLDFPDFSCQIANIDDYLYHKKIERNIADILKSFEDVRKEFHKSPDDLPLLISVFVENIKIHQLPKNNSLNYVVSALMHFQKVPKINEMAHALFLKINKFIREYPNYEDIPVFNTTMEHCVNELYGFILNAKRDQVDMLCDKKRVLKLDIYECVCLICERILENKQALRFLSTLSNINDDCNYTQLQNTLNALAAVRLVATRAQLLNISLSQLRAICANTDDQHTFNSQKQLVLTRLLNLKDRLEVIQRRCDQEEREKAAKKAELQQKIATAKEQMRLMQERKAKQLEEQIALKKTQLAEKASRVQQAHQRALEMQRRKEELAKRRDEIDNKRREQNAAKVIAESRANFKRLVIEEEKRRRAEQQRIVEQKRLEIAQKQQQLEKFRQQKIELAKKREQVNQERQRLQQLHAEKIKHITQARAEIAQKKIKMRAAQQANRQKLQPRMQTQPSASANQLIHLLNKSNQDRQQIKNKINSAKQQLMHTNAYINSQLRRRTYQGQLAFQFSMPPTEELVSLEKNVLKLLQAASVKPPAIQAQMNRIALAEKAHNSMLYSIQRVAYACHQFNQRAAHHMQHAAAVSLNESLSAHPDLDDGTPDNVDYADHIDFDNFENSSQADVQDGQNQGDHTGGTFDDQMQPDISDHHSLDDSMFDSLPEISSAMQDLTHDESLLQETSQHIDDFVHQMTDIDTNLHQADDRANQLENEVSQLQSDIDMSVGHDLAGHLTTDDEVSGADHYFEEPTGLDDISGFNDAQLSIDDSLHQVNDHDDLIDDTADLNAQELNDQITLNSGHPEYNDTQLATDNLQDEISLLENQFADIADTNVDDGSGSAMSNSYDTTFPDHENADISDNLTSVDQHDSLFDGAMHDGQDTTSPDHEIADISDNLTSVNQHGSLFDGAMHDGQDTTFADHGNTDISGVDQLDASRAEQDQALEQINDHLDNHQDISEHNGLTRGLASEVVPEMVEYQSYSNNQESIFDTINSHKNQVNDGAVYDRNHIEQNTQYESINSTIADNYQQSEQTSASGSSYNNILSQLGSVATSDDADESILTMQDGHAEPSSAQSDLEQEFNDIGQRAQEMGANALERAAEVGAGLRSVWSNIKENVNDITHFGDRVEHLTETLVSAIDEVVEPDPTPSPD